MANAPVGYNELIWPQYVTLVTLVEKFVEFVLKYQIHSEPITKIEALTHSKENPRRVWTLDFDSDLQTSYDDAENDTHTYAYTWRRFKPGIDENANEDRSAFYLAEIELSDSDMQEVSFPFTHVQFECIKNLPTGVSHEDLEDECQICVGDGVIKFEIVWDDELIGAFRI